MANLPEIKTYVQLEATETREPVGEFLVQGMGQSTNFLLTRDIKEHQWKANGSYRFFTGKTGTDTVWVAPFDCVISKVIIGHKSVGGTASGSTVVDIERSTNNGSTWGTIFTTKPAILPAAAGFAWCATGQTVTGFTAPVLVGAPADFNVNENDGFRMTINSSIVGNPQDLWIRFILLTRTP